MVRLVPITEAEFPAYLERAVARRADRNFRRGFWTEEAAPEAGRREVAEWLPEGLRTPHHHFAHVVDERTGSTVGETVYTYETKGGKVQFWIDWIWIAPERRRKGYATEALEALAREAAQAGADRVCLKVFADNPTAKALYLKLGFVEMATEMTKPVTAVPRT